MMGINESMEDIKPWVCRHWAHFLVAFLSGICVHGVMLFSTVVWHDDLGGVTQGFAGSLEHGRWFYELLHSLIKLIAGTETTSLHGIVSLVLISVGACILLDIFDIKSRPAAAAFLPTCVAIPVISGHLGYLCSMPFDMLGIVLAIVAAALQCKAKPAPIQLAASLVLLVLSIGEYQCNVSLFASVVAATGIVRFAGGGSPREILRLALRSVATLALAILIYLLVLSASLRFTGRILTSYAGTDTYGIVSARGYLERIRLAYRLFFLPEATHQSTMFPFHWMLPHQLLLGFLVACSLVRGYLLLRSRDLLGFVTLLALAVIFPLCTNLNFLMYNAGSVHSLHMYSYITFFGAVLGIAEVLGSENGQGTFELVKTAGARAMVATVAMVALLYARYDALCYRQAQLSQAHGIAYATELKTRVESAEGYDLGMEVAFIGHHWEGTGFEELSVSDPIITNPYGRGCLDAPNNNAWRRFLGVWAGFNPPYADDARIEELASLDEVASMPAYPSDGSVRVVDGTVVVRISD